MNTEKIIKNLQSILKRAQPSGGPVNILLDDALALEQAITRLGEVNAIEQFIARASQPAKLNSKP